MITDIRHPRWTLGCAVGVVLLLAGCGSPRGSIRDPSAAYFPTYPTGTKVTGTAPPPVTASPPAAQMTPSGPVSRPDSRLTPGSVASTDVNAICNASGHGHAHIPGATQAEVYARYGLAFPPPMHAYSLDSLVPLSLGGAPTADNLWPAKVDGTGFHQKQQLTQRLRLLVCSGQLDLETVQRRIATDWYSMWLTYANN